MLDVEQRVFQGCNLSLLVFINGLFVAVEQAGLDIELSDGGKLEGCYLQKILWGSVSLWNSYRGP